MPTVERSAGDGEAGVGPIVVVGGDADLVARVRLVLGDAGVDAATGSTLSELKRSFDGATEVIVLGTPAAGGTSSIDGTQRSIDVISFRNVLDAAASAPVGHLVVLSTAMVYGAWANNPVPLTEAAVLRPDPGVRYATDAGEIERLVVEWRDDHPAATVAVLRPVVTVHPGDDGWLRHSPWVPSMWRAGSVDVGPPTQYLLLDDLVTAIDVACRRHLDGSFNVAPEGWIPPEVRNELVGPRPQLRLPEAAAELLTSRRLRRAGYPNEVAAYVYEPWVVASDALRAAGWEPADTNEQAFVEADTGGPFASMNARRRQMVSLAAVGLVAAGLVAGAVKLIRGRRA
jgi:nucleoside-diphosphate-sugar epimerase